MSAVIKGNSQFSDLLGDIKRKKILRVILILSGLLLVLLLFFPPGRVESRPLARAIVAYHEDPSPKNKSELEFQQKIVRMIEHENRFHVRIYLAGFLAANLLGLFFVSRRGSVLP